ncbi:MAG: polysulfide reductase NrfD [Acidobacteriota bacterium]|nr:polysulfide reductase NrfD [Acidobacteriota bacterium]
MSGDGRNIDTSLGILTGEASQQKVASDVVPWKHEKPQVFGTEASQRRGRETGDPTYYDRPVIKSPVWSWSIPAYYYTGGVTGGCAVLGAAATLLNRKGLPVLVRKSRWIGVIGATVSAGLLIYDLGKPSLFLNMLRVFRPTSPMSVGSWILVTFSSTAGLSVITEFAPESVQWIGNASAVAAGILGLALSGYTGVLIANTTVPVWQRPHRLLPGLFLASAAASAASLFDLVGVGEEEHTAVTLFGVAGKVAEVGFATLIERNVASVPEAVRPLREGFSGFLWKSGKVLSAASLALSLIPGSSTRLRRATGVLGTAGAICIRFGIHYAGNRSAMNPRATFHQQRQGQGAFEVTGKAAIAGPGGLRSFAPEPVR